MTIEFARGNGAGRGAVLVVDDDPGILWLSCRVVARLGFDPIAAATHREALELTEGPRPLAAAVLHEAQTSP